MVRNRTVALIAVLVLGVALGGCLDSLGGGDDAGNEFESSVNATALAEAAAEATADADSYTVTAEAESETTSGQQTIGQTVEETRTVDTADRRQSVEQTVRGGLQGTETTTEAFILDQTQYVEINGSWQGQQLPADPWAGATVVGNVELLTEHDVTHVRNESVDGAETAVLELDAGEELYNALEGQQSDSSQLQTGSLDVQSATLQYYVALEEPHYVYRIDTEMTTQVDAPTGQLETQVNQTTRFDDFDANVTVDVPASVADAHSE